MSDNRFLTENYETAGYNSLVAAINKSYCSKYGYDFIYYRTYLNKKHIVELENNLDPYTNLPRHSAWSKTKSAYLAVYSALKNKTYDYVVYIDSDCIFKDFNKSLETFIKPYTQDILISNDYPHNLYKACTGFFICKVNKDSLKFLKDWYNYDFKGRANPCRWEQGALWFMYEEKKYDIKLIDNEDFFNEKPGQYLRHIARYVSVRLTKKKFKTPEEQLKLQQEGRNKYFKNFIENNNIEYSKTIKSIKTIDYNTNSMFFRKTFKIPGISVRRKTLKNTSF
jgi:hypothetical protein